MRIGIRPFVATITCVLLPLISGAAATTAEGEDAAKIQELQKQADALNQELAKVQSGTSPQAQQQAMQRHWSMMQNYMQSMRSWPRHEPQRRVRLGDDEPRDDGRRHDGLVPRHGSGKRLGASKRNAGAVPEAHAGAAKADAHQTAAIAAEGDPTTRDALIRQHYYTMYRDMQTMRGLGWMWNRGTAMALPDAGSPGATLETRYCSQCHAAPPPGVHTAKEWADVTGRMQQHITDKSTTNSGVMVPSSSELASIVDYLDKHAKPGT